jgi:hypothetical protein
VNGRRDEGHAERRARRHPPRASVFAELRVGSRSGASDDSLKSWYSNQFFTSKAEGMGSMPLREQSWKRITDGYRLRIDATAAQFF